MSHRLTDLTIHPTTFASAIETLCRWANEPRKRYVSTCTVYTLMRGLEDERIYAALEGADMITADGMPLVWLQRMQRHKFAERVYGPDIMLALLGSSAGTSHFFYGGLAGVPEQLAAELLKLIPGLDVAGAYAPAIAEVGEVPDIEAVERLNTSGASVIWVGLGSPKQDIWMHVHRPLLNAPLLIGVGAAFDFLSGTKSQAPRWMQSRGLEWLFRLYQEPRRLWRRYLIYNVRFMAAVTNLWIRRR